MRMAIPRGSPDRRCAMAAASTATAHATEPSPMITSAAMTLLQKGLNGSGSGWLVSGRDIVGVLDKDTGRDGRKWLLQLRRTTRRV